MKIGVTAKGKTLDDQVDPRFGRCAYFLIVDADTMKAEAIENSNVAVGGGAGIQSAQLMAEHEVNVVLTGNCGPNAYQTLNAADIEVIVGANGPVRDVVEQFKSGSLSSSQAPNVASHFGIGTDATPSGNGAQPSKQPPGALPASGQTGGQMGMGGGMGMGRGMGGGGGRGGGMGRGMGRGMSGGGRGGGGMGQGVTGGPAPGMAGAVPSPEAGGQLEGLKAEAQAMEQQTQAINDRIAQIEGTPIAARLVATVYAGKCTACKRCETVCPARAITIEEVAVIDQERCTGCCLCVAECPQGAITLGKR